MSLRPRNCNGAFFQSGGAHKPGVKFTVNRLTTLGKGTEIKLGTSGLVRSFNVLDVGHKEVDV